MDDSDEEEDDAEEVKGKYECTTRSTTGVLLHFDYIDYFEVLVLKYFVLTSFGFPLSGAGRQTQHLSDI